jgi:hypothetical protein
LEGKFTNKNTRFYGHVDAERIPRKVLNKKVNENRPRGKLRSRWEQQVRKDVTQRGGRRTWEREETEEQLRKDRERCTGLLVRRPM